MTVNTQPQATSVTADRPCDQCGYNLRGQTAAWDRVAHKWRCTCPECGAAQIVTLQSGDRTNGGNAILIVVAIAFGLWVIWSLLRFIALGEAAMMGVPTIATATVTTARRVGSPTAGISVFDADVTTIVLHLAKHALRLILAALGIGAIVGLAPYARPAQTRILLAMLVGVACTVGIWMNLVGYIETLDDVTSQVMQVINALNGGRGFGAAAVTPIDWQWKLVSSVSGVLIAFVAARGGQALGKPTARMLLSMFVPPESRPTLFLRSHG